MLDQNQITFGEHLKFVQSLQTAEDKFYFVVELNNTDIGVIDFYGLDTARESSFYGYYLKPELIGSSLGILLEYLVAEYAFGELKVQTLIAETKPQNTRAMQLHEKFGFVEKGLNSKNLVEATLSSDTWNLKKPLFRPIIERLTV